MFRLDFYSLWYDEATTAYLLQDKPLSEAFGTVLSTTGSETLHPLYYIVLAIWMQIAGSSEAAMRFPSVVFGSGAVVAFALILYQIGGKKALAYGLLIVLSPFLTWYSRDARPYALIMCLTGLHLWLYLKLLARPTSRVTLVGFIATGILCIYAGVLCGIILVAELLWSLFVARRATVVVATGLIMLSGVPLVWHGWQMHFATSSSRYSELPRGMNAARFVGIPQEFSVGRSFGPTPDAIRRSAIRQVFRKQWVEVSTEILAALLVGLSLVCSLRLLCKNMLLRGFDKRSLQALAFVTATCIAILVVLVLATDYKMNARHIAFLFGPLIILAILPIAYAGRKTVKILFVTPVLVLWGWSWTNQVFNARYQQEDFRSAARMINNNAVDDAHVFALCHANALRYYGVENPLHWIREGPSVTYRTIASQMPDKESFAWVVLARPWDYPAFRSNELTDYFEVLQERHFAGIDMWLLALSSGK